MVPSRVTTGLSSRRRRAMLTLTRKVGESIRIGEEIQIVVKEIRRNHVRIGILAPKDVKIYREEVYLNIKTQGGEEDEDVEPV
jgi:carbon storage regulator